MNQPGDAIHIYITGYEFSTDLIINFPPTNHFFSKVDHLTEGFYKQGRIDGIKYIQLKQLLEKNIHHD